jgi:prepilin-type N-terminal cleavage/methylation domain-containing protein
LFTEFSKFSEIYFKGESFTMKSKGFTLIELAVVLAIIAVLAAVLTPMVTGYLDQARLARAQADVRTIADAMKLYNRDTGRWPIYDNSTTYGSDTAAANDIGTATGNTPSNGGGWTVSLGTSSLESYLNNDKTGVGTAAFPKAGFRGPYVGTLDSDPWGNKYLLNANDLRKASTNHAFVISAGPNGAIDTTRDVATTAALAAGGDDIISVIR